MDMFLEEFDLDIENNEQFIKEMMEAHEAFEALFNEEGVQYINDSEAEVKAFAKITSSEIQKIAKEAKKKKNNVA
jgi:hypothetical protein